jgi:hypothetical protein
MVLQRTDPLGGILWRRNLLAQSYSESSLFSTPMSRWIFLPAPSFAAAFAGGEHRLAAFTLVAPPMTEGDLAGEGGKVSL